MLEAPKPRDEKQRLASLHKLTLLNSPLEARFERITQNLRTLLNVPITIFTLVDEEKQWFKSIQGMDATQSERKYALCAHTILGEDVMVINDARQDERFFDNPFVSEFPGINFYAGFPIRSPDGKNIGALCAIDTKPREISEDEIEKFRDLAAELEKELKKDLLSENQANFLSEINAAQRFQYVDPLTRLWKKPAMYEILKRELKQARKNKTSFIVALLDIDSFLAVNNVQGTITGDTLLKKISQHVLLELKDGEAFGRLEDDVFIIIFSHCTPGEAERTVRLLQSSIAALKLGDEEISLTAGFGMHVVTPGFFTSVKGILKKTVAALVKAKGRGPNQIYID